MTREDGLPVAVRRAAKAAREKQARGIELTYDEWVALAVEGLGRPQPRHIAAYLRFLKSVEAAERDTPENHE